MTDERSRYSERVSQVLVFALVLGLAIGGIALFVVGQSTSAIPLAAIPDRVTPGLIVAGTLLFIGAIALPALMLSGWQSAQEDATRDRRQ
ncbi:hypothetical protein GS429_21000 [Natronorubrum sp. JWXQ-INN-674]|uniref:Uncharacterized protein n=1 Tax=Natronorubrum halalkaliphilum TaxID=2691917 RepID=A0A6B0VTL4_9EURY|nr:hypothetical protein [Natronorubrum halalkaliphilum]MXV64503.1 hypothetical protein [Natronorubrum halalkaliphilum]